MDVCNLSKIGQTTAKQTQQNALVVKTPIRRKKTMVKWPSLFLTLCVLSRWRSPLPKKVAILFSGP